MSTLVPLVNRLRSKGWKYEEIRDELVKMGNTPEKAFDAISEYVRDTCGVSISRAEHI